MKEISLTQNKVALVDDEDYDWLNQYKWFAWKTKNSRTYYAVRNIWITDHPRNKMPTQLMHRFVINAPNNVKVDHQNHNGLDNQKNNIRLGSHQQNHFNKQKHLTWNEKTPSSQYKGVSWNKINKKWTAQIHFNNKKEHLGCFHDEIEAALAYDQAAKIRFNEFAYLNFSQSSSSS